METYLEIIAADVPLFAAAVAAHREGRLSTARAHYLELMDQPRLTAICLHQLGVMATQQGDHAKAVELLRHAIRLDDSQSMYFRNLAVSLARSGRQDEASDVLLLLGVTLQGRSAHAEAVAVYSSILETDPCRYGAHVNMGTSLAFLGDTAGAVRSLLSGVALCGTLSPEVRGFLAEIVPELLASGLMHAAPAALAPTGLLENLEQALITLGKCLSDLGHYDPALLSYRLALVSMPGLALAHWDMALELLARGEYEEGWQSYEWRWYWGQFPEPRRRLPAPVWRGEALAGKRVVVTTEQGHGDGMQFSPLAVRLRDMGAQVILETTEPLLRLFQHSYGPHGIEVVCRPEQIHGVACALPVDYVVPLMSLPQRVGLRVEHLPLHGNLLAPLPADKAVWAERLAHLRRPRIGVVWAGRPTHADDAKRSITLAALAPLFSVPGLSWVSLQLERPAQADGQAAELPAGTFDTAPFLKDFADTAAIIANLDLVIAVDTGVAHLAAALGKPTWILLAHVAEWRWLRERTDSPWYSSVRLFRQKVSGDWTDPVMAMSATLRDWSAAMIDGPRTPPSTGRRKAKKRAVA